MTNVPPSVETARSVFRALENSEQPCVILHHFDFEVGGDIDFCVDAESLREVIDRLRDFLKKVEWRIIQILEHEQTCAYIVSGPKDGGTEFLLLDLCLDYRVRGHLVLRASELVDGSRQLDWGGRAAGGYPELAYRFSKAAAKKKEIAETMENLGPLWQQHGHRLRDWLAKNHGVELESWTEESISRSLRELRRCLAKRKWSWRELQLKFRRLMAPRGLWLEVDEKDLEDYRMGLSPCFREVGREKVPLRKVLGSTLVLEKPGNTPAWKRWILRRLRCWAGRASGVEALQFLVERTAHYQGWKRIDG